MSVVHNSEIARLVKTDYNLKDLQNIKLLLEQKGTFNFPVLDNGLFPAATVADQTKYTGYAAVWIRDNVYVAYSHYLFGETSIVINNIKSLFQYFQKHQIRFENIIKAQVTPDRVMERPHIRFNGENLQEINQSWEHAQNDALGYFLWFSCKLISDKILEPTQDEIKILALFPLYFDAVSYWEDEDSGHWEETPKIEASSIGVVVASLEALKQLKIDYPHIFQNCRYQDKLVTIELLDNLIQKGTDALNKILPSECVQQNKERRYDSALLFLIYPLEVLNDSMAGVILGDVINNLQGKYGISRYLNDSFWCRDYTDLPESIRTSISTEREQWLKENQRALKQGEEAQWCIFDPIISTIFGMKFIKTQRKEFLEKQILYLNRSLGQITAEDFQLGGFKCPELYYLEKDNYVPNDATPLLWTQANLRIALKIMEESLRLK